MPAGGGDGGTGSTEPAAPPALSPLRLFVPGRRWRALRRSTPGAGLRPHGPSRRRAPGPPSYRASSAGLRPPPPEEAKRPLRLLRAAEPGRERQPFPRPWPLRPVLRRRLEDGAPARNSASPRRACFELGFHSAEAVAAADLTAGLRRRGSAALSLSIAAGGRTLGGLLGVNHGHLSQSSFKNMLKSLGIVEI